MNKYSLFFIQKGDPSALFLGVGGEGGHSHLGNTGLYRAVLHGMLTLDCIVLHGLCVVRLACIV